MTASDPQPPAGRDRRFRRQARLATKIAPLLPSGVDVNVVILGQRAVSNLWFLVSYMIALLQPYRWLVITDQGIFVFGTPPFAPSSPGRLLEVLSPGYLFGEPHGIFQMKITVGRERLRITRPEWRNLREADADQPRRVAASASAAQPDAARTEADQPT